MKAHISHQEYFALFYLVLSEAKAIMDLQDVEARVFAKCVDRPIRLGLAQVVDLGGDRFEFTLTTAGAAATQTDEALAWFEREADATRAAIKRTAEIVSLR